MRCYAWDIETTGLNAAFDRMLCASFVELLPPESITERPKPVTFRLDKLLHDKDDYTCDAALVNAVVEFMDDVNLICTWNGKLFDVRFLKARMVKHALKYPRLRRPLNRFFHADLMWTWSTHMGTRGRRLAMVERFVNTSDRKTPLDEDTWARAALLTPQDMDLVCEHCEADVHTLSEVYWRILPFVGTIQKQG